MNKKERIQAALKGEKVDRVPVSAWLHFSEVDQDPISLAKAQIAFTKKFDYDFIKMMPQGTYPVQDWGAELKIFANKLQEPIIKTPGIRCIEDYKTMHVLPPYYGTWGKALQLAMRMQEYMQDDIPYIQTIFSPLTILNKLSGGHVLQDIKTHPEVVKEALKVVTETNIGFVEENLKYGVAGFFLATQTALRDAITLDNYDEFARPFDYEVINSYKDKTYFNVLHIHGDNVYFKELLDYPVNSLSWHARTTPPTLKEARTMTDKCFVGGLKEDPYFVDGVLHYHSIMAKDNAEQLIEHVHEAIAQVDGRGIIIGPSCVIDPRAPESNFFALRKSVEK